MVRVRRYTDGLYWWRRIGLGSRHDGDKLKEVWLCDAMQQNINLSLHKPGVGPIIEKRAAPDFEVVPTQ